MNGFGLSRGRFALLFSVMLVAAAGNTAMQSLLPAIGRELQVADIWVAIAFSLSAVIWVVMAPIWAHRADKRGRRALMRLGLYGFIVSMLICGGALAAGLAGWLSGFGAFVIFMLGRTLYGAFGSASPPAVQAYIAARTDGEQRTNAISALASSFGLGTILGPAIAPLFILPPLGLAAPLVAFAGIGALVLLLLILRLPDDTPRRDAKGPIVGYPMMGSTEACPPGERNATVRLRWRDPRVFVWHMIGIVGGHGHAIILGVIGFMIIDRLALPLDQSQHWIAVVLMAGAASTLLAQWWLIPQMALTPRELVLWGSLVAAAGSAMIALAGDAYGLTLGFVLTSLGFGLFRPGFTSGASLSVTVNEQNAVAGQVTSVNGIAFVAGPALGVALYMIGLEWPFVATAVLMLALAGWTWLSFRPSGPAA